MYGVLQVGGIGHAGGGVAEVPGEGGHLGDDGGCRVGKEVCGLTEAVGVGQHEEVHARGRGDVDGLHDGVLATVVGGHRERDVVCSCGAVLVRGVLQGGGVEGS